MAADRLIAAGSLDVVDGTGRTLAAEASSSGGGAALGSGVFGKVGTYRYNGAAVAVKELKAGADEESIGALPLFVNCVRRAFPFPTPDTAACTHLSMHCSFRDCAVPRGMPRGRRRFAPVHGF